MRIFFKLVIDLVKLFALLIGSLLLLGGGVCGSMLGVGGLYDLLQGKDLEQLSFAGTLLAFALLGYGLINGPVPIGQNPPNPLNLSRQVRMTGNETANARLRVFANASKRGC